MPSYSPITLNRLSRALEQFGDSRDTLPMALTVLAGNFKNARMSKQDFTQLCVNIINEAWEQIHVEIGL